MKDNRKAFGNGTKIQLGENEYEIIGIEGYGSNTIVYRAKYNDKVQKDYSHQVLIKELFPYTPDGSIYRDGKNIIVEESKREYFQLHKDSFYIGNQTHMAHLWENPEASGGNINSFEKNGTLYSIYSYDGGISLEQYLAKNKVINLEQSCIIIQNLLDVLATFHKNGVLHLDISPDNILLLPLLEGKKEIQRRVLLIDYNSTWDTKRKDLKGMHSGTKKGYSPPEVMLKKINFIHPASDLFSVCAVFYHMITGEQLTEEEIQSRKIRRLHIENCSASNVWISSVKWKVLEIITKGLWLTPNMRYQTTDELKKEMIDLQDRIQGRGVSKSVLWEISKKQQKEYEKTRKPTLYNCKPIIQWNKTELLEEEKFWEKVRETESNVLLTGFGGIGKTTFLYRYWKTMTSQYSEKQPVVWYLSLLRYQKLGVKNNQLINTQEERNPSRGNSFIRSCLLEEIRTNDQIHTVEDAIWVLNQLMDQKNQLLLLLDGLNEVHVPKGELLKEIYELSRKPGVQIVLTERMDTITKSGIQNFVPCEIEALSKKQVKNILEEQQILYPIQPSIQQLLTNQMMMEMYIEIKKASREIQLEKDNEIDSTTELFLQYYKISCQKIKQSITGMENQILCINYVFEHTLPMIAAEMKRKKKRLLSYEEMMHLLEENYKNLKKKTFLLAFPEYLGTNTCILQEITSVQKWYHFTINEILAKKLKWISCFNGGYMIFHQDFEAYLAELGEEKKKIWRIQQKKAVRKKGVVTAILILFVAIVGTYTWIQQSYPFFEKDKNVVYNNVENMAAVLGKTYVILQMQYQILEKFTPSFLEGTQQQYDRLEQYYVKQEEQARIYASMTAFSQESLDSVKNLKLSIPLQDAEDLYSSAQLQYQSMQEHMGNLMDRVNPSKKYKKEKKEEAIIAYQQYLDAYCNWINQKVAFVMDTYPKEYQEFLYQTLSVSPYFSAIQGKSREELKNGKEEAERELEIQKRNLSLNNL